MLKFNRKRLLVAPEIQLSLAALLFLGLFLTIGLFYYSVQSAFDEITQKALAMSPKAAGELASIVRAQASFIDYVAIVLLLMSCAYVFLIAVVAIHKTVGPIYSLHRNIKEQLKNPQSISEGATVRKSDDYQTLIKDYNELLDKLKKN